MAASNADDSDAISLNTPKRARRYCIISTLGPSSRNFWVCSPGICTTFMLAWSLSSLGWPIPNYIGSFILGICRVVCCLSYHPCFLAMITWRVQNWCGWVTSYQHCHWYVWGGSCFYCRTWSIWTRQAQMFCEETIWHIWATLVCRQSFCD